MLPPKFLSCPVSQGHFKECLSVTIDPSQCPSQKTSDLLTAYFQHEHRGNPFIFRIFPLGHNCLLCVEMMDCVVKWPLLWLSYSHLKLTWECWYKIKLFYTYADYVSGWQFDRMFELSFKFTWKRRLEKGSFSCEMICFLNPNS